jgi:hypothetical protein
MLLLARPQCQTRGLDTRVDGLIRSICGKRDAVALSIVFSHLQEAVLTALFIYKMYEMQEHDSKEC